MYMKRTTKFLETAIYVMTSTVIGICLMCLVAKALYVDPINQPDVPDNTTPISQSYKLENSISVNYKHDILPIDIVDDNEEAITSEYPAIEEELVIEEVVEEPVQEEVTIYTIKTGDNFWNIAKRYYGYGGYCYAMCEYNGISPNTTLHAGDTIIIPSINDEKFKLLYAGLTYNKPSDDIQNIIEYTYSTEYKYGHRMEPKVPIDIPTGSDMKNYTGEVDTSSYTYLGSYFITGYTPGCAHCCGGSTAGIGASGVSMVCGYSVAMSKDIPFGTTIYIEGYGYYVVEDRGVGSGVVDIACPDHNSCGPVTARGINVYIVG